jgi:glycosyltransferase involved in cell wall biosynthesis
MPDPTPEYPLVSAVMLAGATPLADVKRCIDCFHSQTYPRKELIIVNNARNTHEAAKLALSPHNDIIVINSPPESTAGMARNLGVAAANGQIIAQFDADYWHAPSRLSAQIATMANEQANICILASTLQYSYISGRARLFRNKQNAVLNTMVWTRIDKAEYPNISHGEEFGLLRVLLQRELRPIAIDKPELCCKLILTNGERQTTPHNGGLTEEQFAIIKAFQSGLITANPDAV